MNINAALTIGKFGYVISAEFAVNIGIIVVIPVSGILLLFTMMMMTALLAVAVLNKTMIAVLLIGFIDIAAIEFTHLCTT
ncbi:hypothetical protein [Citrobacter braakii]|uniref:hypothetical protein n=1 Tax=Citrobacter braakii TaxID=57706 RepID=UPI00397894D7